MAAPLKLKRQQTAQKLKSNSATADLLPVAAVLVDTPVSHLEGIYDYLVPLHLEDSAVYGTKVIVPFGNTQVDGLIVGRKNDSEQIKNLKMIVDFSSTSISHEGKEFTMTKPKLKAKFKSSVYIKETNKGNSLF